MFKYALNLVLRRPLRTVLTSMGITIAVFLISFIVFGMQDLQSLLVNEFSSRFSPNQVIVSASDMMAMIGGGSNLTYDQEVTKKKTINKLVTDDLESLDYVNEVKGLFTIMGLDATLDEKNIPFPGTISTGWDAESKDSYFVDFWGNDEIVPEKKVWVSTSIMNFYKETADEIIGKSITLTPSSSSIFASKSQSMIGKKFTYIISGVFDPGQDKMDIIFSTKEALSILSELGGFETPDQYVEDIGYDILYVDVNPKDQDEFKSYIDDKYHYKTITSDDIVSILGSITDGLTIALIMFALVSGAVAGVGIINTMIMSIYEQTKEIGVIKALGASDRQVMIIFLIQSGIMGLLGGLLGLSAIVLSMFALDGIVVRELVKAGFVIDKFFHFDFKLALLSLPY